MTRLRWLAAAIAATTIAPVSAAVAQQADRGSPDSTQRQLVLEAKPWTGDLDGMLERRRIRVLVPYSRTLFFTDHGRERGLAAELARDFEGYINRKYAKQLGKRPVTVLLIPTTRDKLLTNLVAGLGDIAAGNLTATDERLKIVDFVAPSDRKPVRELLVTGPTSPAIDSLEDLSGKTVQLRPASSYYESVVALNTEFLKSGKPAVEIDSLPDALEDEDFMEMLNAGIIQLAIVDGWKAKIWARVLPKIRVRDGVVLRSEGYTGWAIRKESPTLQGSIEAFYRTFVKKQGVIETRLVRYQKQIKQIANNTNGQEWRRLQTTIALFRKYGDRYGFDPLMLAAQGFQESQLNQNAKSHVGAVGVMQIMPATGAELNVGDIHTLEPNIHAGAKYMNRLMTRYFSDAHFPDEDRTLFAFASYNAGPGNIARMRRLAEKRGLDPDRWFNNVELVVADRIGIETTTYVRNIYKYYVAYKLTLRARDVQQRAREGVPAAGGVSQ